MARTKTKELEEEVEKELAAIVRAGCLTSEEEALREALQPLFAMKPQLRVEMAIQRYLDAEITLARAAEIAGVSRWRFQELLAQRGIQPTLEARSKKELDQAVERMRGLK